ncbi:AAA family ATPase [Aliarcobacter butzleri]|uniref:AAA family ATPase n=1 Tax=Aliarcobacter butzleri TaxID=28197 RepID=UPI002B23F5B6|nr:AAA family ATPase [Aliarcobacter butzleri]
MELVYLWVEKYKNIEKQGFNFSPRFRCEYDEEKNELTINENKDYVSIFPDNINVTAIVGENGSGKSSIISFIFNNINNEHKSFNVNNYIFILFKDGKKFIFSTIQNIHPDSILISTYHVSKNENKTLNLIMNSFYISLYDFKISSNSSMKNKQGKKDYFPNRILNFKKIEKIDSKLIFNEILLENEKRYFTKYFSPSEIKIVTNSLFNAVINEKDRKEFIEIRYLSDDIDKNKNIIDSMLFVIYTYLSSLLYKNFRNKLRNLSELKKVSSLKIFRKVLSDMLHNLKEFYSNERIQYPNIEILLNELNNIFQYSEKIIENKHLLSEIFDMTFYHHLHDSLELKTDIDKLHKKKEMFYFFENLPECLDVIFIDKEKNVSNDMLSSGEKSLLRIKYYLENIIRKEKKQFFIILLDEVENEIHPQWQAKLLRYLIDIFKDRNIQIHFVLNSHSPFILSDLQKENVIFLEKGKQVYPFEDGKQTFGANIHTLLSHGFFMKDGLMGEFAKEKIQSIIKYHENIEKKEVLEADKVEYKTKKQKEFWQIQSIIGDDYLKQVIKNHLMEIEKIVLGNDEAKKEEVKRLKAQIELLEK